MFLKLPIMLLSIAPKFPLLCSNYAPIMLSCVPLCSKYAHIKLCLDCSIRVPNASVNVLLECFISLCGDCSTRVYQSSTNFFFTT